MIFYKTFIYNSLRIEKQNLKVCYADVDYKPNKSVSQVGYRL